MQEHDGAPVAVVIDGQLNPGSINHPLGHWALF